MITNEEHAAFLTALNRWDMGCVDQVLGQNLRDALNIPMENKAFQRAGLVHQGRLRDDGEPYLNHCIRVKNNALAIVACRRMTPTWHREQRELLASVRYLGLISAAGLCHDNIEDGKNPKEEAEFLSTISQKSGCGDDLLTIVELLSKKEGESYYDFIHRIADPNKYLAPNQTKIEEILCIIAQVVKAADLHDNMLTCQPGSRLDKYRFALDIIDPFKEMRRWE